MLCRRGLLLLLGFMRLCVAQFHGGTIMWKPNASSPLQVDFTFRIAFTRSHAGGSHYCDRQTISSQSLLGSAGPGWEASQCDACVKYGVHDSGYYCSEFSKFQDWTAGGGLFTFQFNDAGPWQVSYGGCCWSGFSGNGAGNFSLSTTLNLTTRSDTGQINSSPVSASLPIIRQPANCHRVIKFPREDPDGDTVRCLKVKMVEAPGNGNPVFNSLDKDKCTLTFDADSNSIGRTYAVVLRLQDYSLSSRGQDPLSSVDLQFTLEILNVSSSCGRKPVFTDATPTDGMCIPVAVGSVFDARLEAKHTDPSEAVAEIQIVAPRGVFLSGFHYSRDDSDQRTYYRQVSWTPTAADLGIHLICFAALDAAGVQSDMRCITLLVVLHAASPMPDLQSRNPKTPDSHKGSGYTSFNISFDHKIQKPQQSAFIRVFLNDHEIYKLDTLSSDVSIGDDRTVLHFQLPDVVLSMRGTYYILMDSGVVVAVGCLSGGLPTPGISSSSDWTFYTSGACSSGFYVGPPGFKTCIDVDECDTTQSVPTNISMSSGVNTFVLRQPNHCSHMCVNTQGSFQCACPSGFVLDPDGRSCIDNNECQRNSGGCSHTCVNRPGSFYCACPTGLLLASDNVTCQDPGVSVKCNEDFMEVKLVRAHFSRLDPSLLHLRFAACKATISASHIILKTPLNGCGTTYRENATTVTFSNEVRGDNKVIDGVVTRMNDFSVSFHCTFSRREVVAISFDPRSVAFGIEGGGYGNLTFGVWLYKSEAYSEVYTAEDYPITVPLGDRLFVEYYVQSSSAELVVFADRCKAASDAASLSWPSYDFITDGCAMDTTMYYNYKLGNVQRFSLEAFRFLEDYETVYLHCELLACHQDSSASRCAQGCSWNNRKRRSADIERGADGTSTYRVRTGPIKLTQSSDAGNTDKRKAVIGGSVAAGGAGLILLVVGGVLAVKYRLMRFFTSRSKVANMYANSHGSQEAFSQQMEGEEQPDQGELELEDVNEEECPVEDIA